MIDAPDQQYALRAERVAREFKLNAVLRGSGQEYRRLEEIAATGRAVVVPVNFAKAPNVASPEAAMQASLEDLMDWDLQPENPARLERAGVKFALTGHGLRERDATFLKAASKAVARGLPADAALRALTVTPAELLGLSRSHGTIEVGKSAGFVVTDGDLFDEKTKVLETWVDGARYEVTAIPKEDVRGTWAVRLGEGDGGKAVMIKLTGEPTRLRGRLTTGTSATRPATQALSWLWFGGGSSGGGRGRGAAPRDGTALANLTYAGSQVAFTFKGDAVGMDGVVQVSATASADRWVGTGVRPDGSAFAVSASARK